MAVEHCITSHGNTHTIKDTGHLYKDANLFYCCTWALWDYPGKLAVADENNTSK